MDNLEEMNLVELGNKETKNVNGGSWGLWTMRVVNHVNENKGAFLPPISER